MYIFEMGVVLVGLFAVVGAFVMLFTILPVLLMDRETNLAAPWFMRTSTVTMCLAAISAVGHLIIQMTRLVQHVL